MMSNNAALDRRADYDATAVQSAPAGDAATDVVDIATRFGTICIERRQRIRMPRGMAGFAECKEFGIARMPDPRFPDFLVLQSLDEPSVSFLLLPEACLGEVVASKHRATAARDLGVDEADMALAFVVAVRRTADGPEISVNLRAPVLVDARRQLGWQYILPYGDYPIRRVIDGGGRPAGEAGLNQP